MKILSRLFASVLLAAGVSLVSAADPKPVARVLTLLEIETEDPSGYATWIAQYNAIAKARLGVDNYLRVFQTYLDGHGTARVRVASSAANAAEMTKNGMALETDPGILELNTHLRQMRKMGSRVLYQALRFEGTHPRGMAVYSTFANVTDEAAYLEALNQLRTLFDSIGLNDLKISAYRTLVGRTDHTHYIAIAAPNQERLAVFIDHAGTNPKLQAWLASSAKLRTVVSTLASREISK